MLLDCIDKTYRLNLAKTQCFPSSKTLSTLRLCVGCVWIKYILKVWQWDIGGWVALSKRWMLWKPQYLGFSVWYPPYNFVDNESIYSVGEGEEMTHLKSSCLKCLKGHSRVGLAARYSWDILTFEFLHVLLTWLSWELLSRANCELVINSTVLSNLH